MKIFSKTVYHGSPHNFDKFDLSFMGTGEGAQVHGWGMYFAEDMETSETYSGDKNLTQIKINGKAITQWGFKESGYADRFLSLLFEWGKLENVDITKLMRMVNDRIDTLRELAEDKEYIKEMEELRYYVPNVVNGEIGYGVARVGMLAEIELPDDLIFAKERELISNQIEQVQNALREMYNKRNLDFSEDLNKSFYYVYHKLGRDKEISLELESLGIDGIEYYGGIDGHCYVIFNPEELIIKAKL